MEENFEWYKDGVKAIMKAWQTSRSQSEANFSSLPTPQSDPQPVQPNEIMGLTADILEAEKDYQTAVEALLGESLQYVLVKDQAAGLRAVTYLRATGAGRGGFIPLDGLALEMAPEPSPPANAHRLLHHVSVKPGFEAVAKALFGHSLVAGDIKEALSMCKDSESHPAIVTLAGDVVSPLGILIGGNRDNLSGILAKKQELKELAQLCDDLEIKLEEARKLQKQLEGEVRSIEIDLQQSIEKKTQATVDETEAEKALYRTSEDLKHAARHLEIVRLEQEQIMGEESDLAFELEKVNQTLGRIEAEVAACQQTVNLTTEEILRLSNAMEPITSASSMETCRRRVMRNRKQPQHAKRLVVFRPTVSGAEQLEAESSENEKPWPNRNHRL
jgi:chromosome segregation protein